MGRYPPGTSGLMRHLCLRCVALLVLASGPALGAVRFDSAASATGSGGRASLDLTVGTGANRFVVVAVAMPANVSVTDRSFGGRPMAPFGDTRGASCHIEVYGAVAPASGTGTAAVTISSSAAAFVVAAAAYDGVDQVLPTDDSSSQNQGAGTAPFASVLTGAPGIAFGALCATGAATAAARSGQSLRWSRATGNLLGSGVDAAGREVGWQLTSGGAVNWAVAALPLMAAPGGAPVPADAGAPPMPDAAAPPDAARPPPADAAPDTTRLADLAPQPPPPDARPPVLDGNAIAPPEEPREPDPGAEPPPVRVVDLRVGNACAAAPGHAPRSLGALALILGLIVVVARRRPR